MYYLIKTGCERNIWGMESRRKGAGEKSGILMVNDN